MSKKSILYVEDDLDDQQLFVECLNEIAPTVSCHLAKDGYDALQKVDSIAGLSCIYLDINMPRMNGIELLITLRQNPKWNNVPIFILSTSLMHYTGNQIKELGAEDFVKKPNSIEEMSQLLNECFREHQKKWA